MIVHAAGVSRRTFLIKVNPDSSGDAARIVQEPSQLSQGIFSTGRPRQKITHSGRSIPPLTREQRANPRPGDQVYIWINEEYGGAGLTARGEVVNVSTNESGLSVTVIIVALLLAAGINRTRAQVLAVAGNIFDDVLRSTSRTTLRWISDQDVQDIDAAVRRYTPS
jgi:hypothetical protein